MNLIHSLAPQLWQATGSLKLAGTHVGTRMVLCRDSHNKLTLISPIRPTDTLIQEVRELGEVENLVIPNLFHHLYIKHWIAEFPKAQIFAPPGIEKKRKDLLGSQNVWEAHTLASDELNIYPIKGVPSINEAVFYHGASHSLIVTDLLFHFCHGHGLWDRWMKKFVAGFGHAGMGLIFRNSVKDRQAFAESLQPVLTLKMERIVLPHDTILSEAPKKQLLEALQRYFPEIESPET